MGTILLTGATGTVGSEVMKSLAETGASFRIGVRDVRKTTNLPSGVEPVVFDSEQPVTMEKAMQGAETLFLLTPFTNNSVEMGLRILDSARKARVKRIVKLSALGCDFEPGITIGRWHRQVEKEIEASGLAYTFLRPNGFMQNFVTFQGEAIRKNGVWYSSGGQGAVSWVDVRDIAAVAVRVLTGSGHDGKAYEITGPEALTEHQIAEILSAVLDRHISYVSVSDEMARKAMITGGMPEWTADCLIELHGIYRAGYASKISPVVQQLTGREPGSFEQFARDHQSQLS